MYCENSLVWYLACNPRPFACCSKNFSAYRLVCVPICLKTQFKRTAELVNEIEASLQYSISVKGEVVHICFWFKERSWGIFDACLTKNKLNINIFPVYYCFAFCIADVVVISWQFSGSSSLRLPNWWLCWGFHCYLLLAGT